jgi:O-antigen/teichoic acid export membrane protein
VSRKGGIPAVITREFRDQNPPRARGPERARDRLAQARSDHLLRNSFFIVLTSATMGALGFAFWLVGARLFTPHEIGLATTLISATVLISYLSMLGFNSTFIGFLPTSTNRDAEINTGLICVLLAAVVAATAYIVVVPSFVPALAFARSSAGYAIGFVVLTAFAAVNLATDSVFVASRAAKYNFVVDGLIQGGTKLALLIALVGIGAYGIFAASGLAALGAVGFSLFFMVRRLAYRPRIQISTAVIRQVFSFSALNYAASLLNIVPILLLPLIVINGRGPAQAGYYYVTFQIATLFYTISYAISQSLFAEGSYAGMDLGRLARRSAKVTCLTMVPAMALLSIGGRLLLLVLGGIYNQHAAATLAVFGLAVPAVSLNAWTGSLLKLTKQLRAMVWSNAVFVVVICGLALAWVHHGLGWVAFAWLLGNLVSGAVGGVALAMRLRQVRPADA